MSIRIKVQHLASTKEISIQESETLGNLKKHVMDLFMIPVEEQALFLDGRSLRNSSNQIDELGLKDGSLVIIKRIRKIEGKDKDSSLNLLMKNPMVKSIMKNPQSMASMKESMSQMFPDLKQEMEENSSLNMLMNNGEMGEEFEKFANNEDYANIQLRNNDILLAKLENTPEGIRLVSGISKEAQNLSNLQGPSIDLKGGVNLTEKNQKAFPGKCKKNSLIKYRKELLFLKQIGYDKQIDNIEALNASNGDIQAATEILETKYKRDS